MPDAISLEELSTRLRASAPPVVVETLDPSSFEQGHIEGAINLRSSDLHARAPELLPDNNADIVVYCGGGG